jgi:succinate dehydrogenase hydrophobic anchor subunit
MEKIVTGILSIIIAIPMLYLILWLLTSVVDQVTGALGFDLPGYADFLILFAMLLFGPLTVRAILQRVRGKQP